MKQTAPTNITDRQAYLLELRQFINESQRKADLLLEHLGWNEEKTLKPKQSKIKDESQPDVVLSKHFLRIDPDEFSSLVGECNYQKFESFSADEMIKNLSTKQRLAVYEHCIKKTGHLSEPEISVMIHPEDGGSKQMTFAEIVAQKRNAKRRTTRYRTGASQSYVSELRNLIELQMSALSQYADSENESKYRHESPSLRSPHRPSSSSHSHRREFSRERYSVKHKKHKSPKRHR